MKKGSIVIVEDEKTVAAVLKRMLIELNYEVMDVISSGGQVIPRVHEQRPDLILMDIFIDGEADGIELAGELREKFNVPVIFMSGHSSQELTRRAKESGAMGYILKPFKVRELEIAIEMALYKVVTEKELRLYRTRLEALVEERSRELRIANNELVQGINDREKVTQMLNSTRDRMHFLLSASPAIIYTCAPGGNYDTTFVSENIKDILGYEPRQFLEDSQFWHSRVHPQDSPGIIEQLSHLFDSEYQTCEYRFLNNEGKNRWILDKMRLIRDNKGNPQEIIGYMIDITSRKEAEEELKKNTEQLRELAAYLESIREKERTRIARELHDELGQTLTSVKIELQWLIKKLVGDEKNLVNRAQSLETLLDENINIIKRIAWDLRPRLLDDFGLLPAMEEEAQKFRTRTEIECEVAFDREYELSREQSTAIFRIFQEALTNVTRHSKATKVSVSVEEKEGRLVLRIADNGVGIKRKEIDSPKSLGLTGMRERVHYFGGDLNILGVKGKGTVLKASFPVGPPAKIQ